MTGQQRPRLRPGWFRRGMAWRVIVALLIGGTMSVVMLRNSSSDMFERIEASLLDLRFRLRRTIQPPSPVTLVVIDDSDISSIGRWPWSREVHASLVRQIAAMGAKVIAFDLLFTEPQSGDADAALAQAIGASRAGADPGIGSGIGSGLESGTGPAARAGDGRNAPVPVIVPFAIDLAPSRVAPSLPPPAPPRLVRTAYPRVLGSIPDLLPEAVRLRLPVATLGERLRLAHVSLLPDSSAAFRREYPVLRYRDDYYPSLALEAVRLFKGLRRADVVIELGRAVRVGDIRIPIDGGQRMLVNYRPPGGFETVNAVDVLEGRAPPNAFSGRIVLIGTTAIGIGDVVASPYSPTLPGVERHAMLIASMLDKDFLRRDDLTAGLDVVTIVLCALFVGLAARRGLAVTVLVAVLLLLSVTLLNFAVFNRFGLWLDLLFPALTVLLALGVMVMNEQLAGAATLAHAEEQARRDPLTGLCNRVGLNDWLQRATTLSVRGRGDRRQARPGTRLLVVIGDLDGFKAVNDTYGHPVGDRLLQEAASRMLLAMRITDLVARLGGDEFVLIFKMPDDASAESTVPAVQRVLDSVVAPYAIDGVTASVGMSLGGACWPDHDPDINRVLKLADATLYTAKKQGKGRVALYAPPPLPRPVPEAASAK